MEKEEFVAAQSFLLKKTALEQTIFGLLFIL